MKKHIEGYMTMNDRKIKSDLEKMYDATASIYGLEYQNSAGYYFMWRKIKIVSYTTNEIKQMLQNAGFKEIEAKRILYTPKSNPSAMLGFMKGMDFVGERLPFVNEFVAIIVCKGIK